MEKLLIVTDTWAPQVNGVATVFAALVPRLQKRGIEVTVVHPGLFRPVPFLLYPEVAFIFFPSRRMRKIFDAEQPTHVHIATEWILGFSARRVCVERGIPFTTSYHTNFPLYARHYILGGSLGGVIIPFALRYMRWFHRKSCAVLANTQSSYDVLSAEGYTNLKLWPLGIDTDRFVRDQSRAPKLDLKHPVFLYMGRVAKEKNIEEFLEADLPGTKLVIGDGPARAALEKRYGNIAIFAGYKYGQELVDWLSLGDVCVSPSRTETFGLAMAEALACGLPVAAHDVMGPRDVITPGVDGVLDEDIGRAALACLTLSRDACRTKALQYSWDTSADLFLKYAVTTRD